MTSIGLIVFIIGSVMAINTTLKAFVFKQVDYNYYNGPNELYLRDSVAQVEALKNCENLTEEDRANIELWLEDYQNWKENSKNYNPAVSNRQREASNAIAMILVGFPIYFMHWRIIKKEKREEETV